MKIYCWHQQSKDESEACYEPTLMVQMYPPEHNCPEWYICEVCKTEIYVEVQ